MSVAKINCSGMFATYYRINLDSIVFRCTSVFYSYVDTVQNLRERHFDQNHLKFISKPIYTDIGFHIIMRTPVDWLSHSVL